MRTLQVDITRDHPAWSQPLWETPATYRGAKGGRSSGKSHEVATECVERMVCDADYSIVCIREIQKSLKYSAKRLIEAKIRELGVAHLFKITNNEIRRKWGTGICIFEGMQSHNADSIKSLEGFDFCWVEEAQTLSQISLDMLIPTIRKPGSEIVFTWNPDQPDDAVDAFFAGNPANSVCVHVNYIQNPWCPENVKELAVDWKRRRPDTYDHVWLGGFNTKPDDQVLLGCWEVDEFDIDPAWDGPYFGADFGYSIDPATLIGVYIDTTTKPNPTLYVRHELYAQRVEVTDYPEFYSKCPEATNITIRGDNSRPEIISHIQRHKDYRKMIAAPKWENSVLDGITFLRGFNNIVIHPDCKNTAEEARLWKWKRDRITDEVTNKLADGFEHCWDAVRYALALMIQQSNNMAELLKMATGTR